MLDMILGLAGAAVGLLLFAAGRYTTRPGPIAAKRRAAISREIPSRRPEDGRRAPSASAEGGLAGALQFSPLRRRRDAASR